MTASVADASAVSNVGPILQDPSTYYESINSSLAEGANPTTLLILASVVAVFLIFSSYLGGSPTPSNYAAATSSSSSLLTVLGWGVLIFLMLVNGVQYLFDVNISTGVQKLLQPVPEIDIELSPADASFFETDGSSSLSPVPEIELAKQVFHIPGNKYTYQDAEALCTAYDARLASYEEIDAAHDRGAEWCSYGWSQDQLALYPTQKSTYDVLQDVDGHEHDCGRPGINGGYIANPNVRFGVNCYGYKPKITPKEQSAMRSYSVYPRTHEDIVLDKKAAKYREKLSNIKVSPFNGSTWSRF